MSGSNNIFVTDTLTNAVFDGRQLFNTNPSIPITLSGTFIAEYSADGSLIGVGDVSMVAYSTAGGSPSTLDRAYINNGGTPGGLAEINVNNNGGGGSYNNAYLDFTGLTPSALDSGLNSSIGNPSGLEYLNGGSASNDGVIASTVNFGGDTYISSTLTNVVFDGSGEAVTLNGTLITEYDAGGTLIGVSNVSLVASDSSDTSSYPTTLTSAVIDIAGTPGAAGGAGINEIKVTGTGGSFQQAYLDFFGQTPSQLQSNPGADGGHYSSIGYPGGIEALAGGIDSSFGTGTDTMDDTRIYTTIANLIFDNDGLPVTVSGTFEADYNPGGTLVGVRNVELHESGDATETFTQLGDFTAGNPTAGGQAALNQLAFYGPDSLYLDFFGQRPDAAFTGSYGNEYSSVYVSGVYEKIGILGNAGTFTDTQTAPCFAAGTRILTETGDVNVETLRAGQTLIFTDGTAAPIIWIGHRRLAPRRHPRPETVQPIRIEAGALADGIPARALTVSPDHAMFLDGILVPAKTLLNGASIIQLDVETITYYHIETARHAILLAEGSPAETYLETGNRGAFANGVHAVSLHPDFAQTQRHSASCAPFADAGARVEAIRAKILARARTKTTANPNITIVTTNGGATIISRAAIAADTTPDPRDRRLLGIKLASLRIGGRDIPLDHPDLTEGWHSPEPDGRWTNGAAYIPASLTQGETCIEIIVAATIPYRIAA